MCPFSFFFFSIIETRMHAFPVFDRGRRIVGAGAPKKATTSAVQKKPTFIDAEIFRPFLCSRPRGGDGARKEARRLTRFPDDFDDRTP
jgi:hypothetical protein